MSVLCNICAYLGVPLFWEHPVFSARHLWCLALTRESAELVMHIHELLWVTGQSAAEKLTSALPEIYQSPATQVHLRNCACLWCWKPELWFQKHRRSGSLCSSSILESLSSWRRPHHSSPRRCRQVPPPTVVRWDGCWPAQVAPHHVRHRFLSGPRRRHERRGRGTAKQHSHVLPLVGKHSSVRMGVVER